MRTQKEKSVRMILLGCLVFSICGWKTGLTSFAENLDLNETYYEQTGELEYQEETLQSREAETEFGEL